MEYSEKEIQKRISAHLFNHNLDLVFTETLGAENAFAAVARQLLERSWDNAVDKLLLQSYLALAHDQSAISSFEIQLKRRSVNGLINFILPIE